MNFVKAFKKSFALIAIIMTAIVAVAVTQQDNYISADEAVAIAMDEIEGKISVPGDSKPIVEFGSDTITVTFPTNLPPNMLGPDYHGQVIIDKQSGEIIEVLAGS